MKDHELALVLVESLHRIATALERLAKSGEIIASEILAHSETIKNAPDSQG